MAIAKRLRDERRKEKAIVSEDEQREMIREKSVYESRIAPHKEALCSAVNKRQKPKWKRSSSRVSRVKE